MAVYVGYDECQVIYVAKNGQQLRVSSVWVGDHQVFPPADRQEIHVFTRDTQGYGRVDNGSHFAFTAPVPWWATSMDVVIIGAGEKGQDGTKSIIGGEDGAGGKSGAWVVKTVAINNPLGAFISIGKGNSVSPSPTEVFLPTEDFTEIRVWDGEGTRTSNNGSTGGTPSPQSRDEYGQRHNVGAGGSRNNPGTHPGGGGGGGQGSGLIGDPQTGRDGGDGYVWLRFRSNDPIGGGFAIIVGTDTGAAYGPIREWAESIGKTYQTITEITVPIRVAGPSLNSLFDGCSRLREIPPMNLSQVTNVGGMFNGCASLTGAELHGAGNAFQPGSGEFPRTLDMLDTKLNAAAANALMQSLGTPPPGGTLQLPATATGANTSIATAKNWQVTIG